MGTRYFLSGNCPKCKRFYYEAHCTSDFRIVEFHCQCGHVIAPKEASNRAGVKAPVEGVCKQFEQKERDDEM